MKKGTVVYFKNSRLIEWEFSLPDCIKTNKLYTVNEVGCHGQKNYIKIWDSGNHLFHIDHFVKVNTELLDINVFEIGDDVECINNSHSDSGTMGRLINSLVIGKKYKVQDYVISNNNIAYIIC